MDAASRQIDAAIRMTFDKEDQIAIHTVASAAQTIVKQICENRGDVESYLRFKDWIAPGYEAEFWNAMNRSANFLKHADRDMNAVHALDEDETDYVIMFAARWCHDLGSTTSPEMRTFACWFSMCHPKTLSVATRASLASIMSESQVHALTEGLKALSRSERLDIGRLMLQQARGLASTSGGAAQRLIPE
jgi:hypothetical protein